MTGHADVPAAATSSLCAECGICCGWSIFAHVPLSASAGEVAWAADRRLPILQRGERVAFRLPCSLLQTSAAGRVCGDYAGRPEACRQYECKVLSRYKSGALTRAEALDLVSQARRLVDAVESRAGAAPVKEYIARLWHRSDPVLRPLAAASGEVDPEVLLDLGVLQTFIAREFHRAPAGPVAGDEEVQALVAKATDMSTWERLFASLGGPELGEGQAPAIASPGETLRDLRDLGYARLGSVLGAAEAAALASLVSATVEAGWPAVFVLMHPGPWDVLRRFEPLLSSVLGQGYELLRAAWAWHLAPGAQSRGWPPHRDHPDSKTTDDGGPPFVTVWIALSDAHAENGCMYVLPRPFDPYYATNPERFDVHDVQSARALPAAAGTALAWTDRALHWGGRSSRHAASPRISMAFEFARTTPPSVRARDVIDRSRVPSPEERLQIIAQQIAQYEHMSGLDDRMNAMARRILSP
jgi:hypothetical protein